MQLAKTVLSGLLLFTLAAPAQSNNHAATEKKLQQTEEGLWQAWKEHKSQPFEAILPDNAINITPQGIQTSRSAMLKDLTDTSCDIKSVSMSDVHFQWIDNEDVMMTYTAQQDASCGGNKLPAKVWASSAWHKAGGKWVSPFHQETAAQ